MKSPKFVSRWLLSAHNNRHWSAFRDHWGVLRNCLFLFWQLFRNLSTIDWMVNLIWLTHLVSISTPQLLSGHNSNSLKHFKLLVEIQWFWLKPQEYLIPTRKNICCCDLSFITCDTRLQKMFILPPSYSDVINAFCTPTYYLIMQHHWVFSHLDWFQIVLIEISVVRPGKVSLLILLKSKTYFPWVSIRFSTSLGVRTRVWFF